MNPEQCNGPMEPHTNSDGVEIDITFGDCLPQEAISKYWYAFLLSCLAFIMILIQIDYFMKLKKDRKDASVDQAKYNTL